MPSKTKTTAPELVRPAGSHSLVLGYGREFGPFEREEFYPVLELEAPRVGRVRVSFEVNRYVHSCGWSEWRILLRDVRRPDPERPTNYGPEVSGVGPATRDVIRDACSPVIEAWLGSDEYDESRRRAAARAIVGKIDAPRGYTLDGAAVLLEELEKRGDIDSHQAQTVREAIRALYGALELLEEVS